MSNMFNFPEYKKIIYLINNETGRYEKQHEIVPFEKLPYELKVETTREQKIINNGATEIITGRIKKGNREFFTGLIPDMKYKHWFFGNDYMFLNGVKKNSLVIFNFRNDNRELIVYYFNSYYKYNRDELKRFVCSFIHTKVSV